MLMIKVNYYGGDVYYSLRRDELKNLLRWTSAVPPVPLSLRDARAFLFQFGGWEGPAVPAVAAVLCARRAQSGSVAENTTANTRRYSSE